MGGAAAAAPPTSSRKRRRPDGAASTITNGALNTVPVPATAVTAGTTYWSAILGPNGGGGSPAETSSGTALTALPAAWTTGTLEGLRKDFRSPRP